MGVHNSDVFSSPRPNDDISNKITHKDGGACKGGKLHLFPGWTSPQACRLTHLPNPSWRWRERTRARAESEDQWRRYLHTHSRNAELATVASQKRASFVSFCLPKRLSGKDSPVSAEDVGDPGSIPGSGSSPGRGSGNPLQYSCPENPMGRRAWWATVRGLQRVGYDGATKHSDTSILHWRRLLKSKACSPRTRVSTRESPPGKEYKGNWKGAAKCEAGRPQ